MKIRSQFLILITCIVLVPLVFAVSIPLYRYYTSPERVLIKGYQDIRKMDELQISDDDWDMLFDSIKKTPPDVQVVMVSQHTKILISNMPEFPAGSTIDDHTLFARMQQTSSQYYYQVVSPPLKDTTEQILIISRVSRDRHARDRKGSDLFVYGLWIVPIFELICICAVFFLSQKISQSIMTLEKNTQRIASGDLDAKVEIQQHLLSDEIRSLSDSLEKMRQSLKDDAERRTRFIMGISHDLRTPVALIKGYTEAISDGVVNDPETVKKSLEIIGTKTNQLETMIDTLINFVKLDNRQWRQNLVLEPIQPLLKDFANGVQLTGEVYKKTIKTDINVPADLKVPMDKMLFNRMLENLFSNALRYTKEGDSITLRALYKDNSVIITISDSGCGISDKDKQHIFELFYRGTNSRREEGMGIGLSVVKNIVDTHGWKINVESEVNKGTSFIITIPAGNSKLPEK